MHSGNIGLSQNLETLVEVPGRWSTSRTSSWSSWVGVKKAALKEQASGLPKVKFLPFQLKERLQESFASADVFVVSLRAGMVGYIVPSKLCGIPAAGRPYVAAVEDSSEVAVMTRRHGAGIVVSPGRENELADAVLKLYHDRGLAERWERVPGAQRWSSPEGVRCGSIMNASATEVLLNQAALLE
jgi:glycosyltransferase involved in cell wall biosynthesis